MNAVLEHTKRRAARTTKPVAQVDTAREAFRQLYDVLMHASHTDEPHLTGDSDRLLDCAASMADAASLECWIDRDPVDDAEVKAYDIAALVIASVKVEGDTCSAERLALLRTAEQLLAGLADDKDVLRSALDAWSGQARDGNSRREPHPLLSGLLGQLRIAEAMTMFAFKGVDGESNPGSIPNGLLDMAADHMAAIISGLHEKHSFNESDQSSLLFELGRFEHLIHGAIGSIERERRLSSQSGESEDFREGVRLEYLDELIAHAEGLHRDCDMGLWTPMFKETGNV